MAEVKTQSGYRVPFVDMPTHFKKIEAEIMETIHSVLAKGNLILRDDMKNFEHAIADFCGTKYAVGLNSGFDALHLSVRAAGIGPGDEVITVGHTFVATVAAIVHVGATPILVDIAEDFNISVSEFEKAITPRTRAVIPVHLNGRLSDMEKIMAIAKKHNLIVIEDACQSLGASQNGKRSGSFGLTGCFSLYPFKLLGAFGDGGIVTTNDESIAKKIISLRDHGQNRSTGEVLFYGFNCRLDNLQAAILNVKFKNFPADLKRRQEIADKYYSGLKDVPELRLPHFPKDGRIDVYQNYVIRAERRDDLAVFLKENGIEVLISWPRPMTSNKGLNLGHFKLPLTEAVCHDVLSLPMNTEINDEQVEYVIETVKEFYG